MKPPKAPVVKPVKKKTLAETSKQLATLERKVMKMSKTNSEFKAILDKELGEIRSAAAAQKDVVVAIRGLLEGNAALVAALTAQVKELLLGGGVEDALVASVVEAMDATEAAITTNTADLVAAGVANTPADPAARR